MTSNEQYKHYGSVIIPMCEGTALEDRPWECIRFIESKNILTAHPNFDPSTPEKEFAVAILEDKPVFIRDRIYSKFNGESIEIIQTPIGVRGVCDGQANRMAYDIDNKSIKKFTWKPPESKRTFMLNGVELPCPLKEEELDGKDVFRIVVADNYFYFNNYDDGNLVDMSLLKVLIEAREK